MSFNTLERIDDKIDKLTSLVSKMNVKMDKCATQLKPQIYQRKEGDRIDVIILRMTTREEIDNLVETETHHIEVEEDSARITHKIIEGDLKTILGMTIEKTIIENKGIEIGVAVETITDILIEVILEMTICETEILVETGVEQDNHIPHQEGNIEELAVCQYQDQHPDLGQDQFLG